MSKFQCIPMICCHVQEPHWVCTKLYVSRDRWRIICLEHRSSEFARPFGTRIGGTWFSPATCTNWTTQPFLRQISSEGLIQTRIALLKENIVSYNSITKNIVVLSHCNWISSSIWYVVFFLKLLKLTVWERLVGV
jgi:hypothetical protein